MGNEALARLVSRRLPDLGLIANLVEYPAVAKGQARFRMQVMANHTALDISEAVRRLKVAYTEAMAEFQAIEAGAALPAYEGRFEQPTELHIAELRSLINEVSEMIERSRRAA
jgi:hypothetical protein